ncbi:MAG TPA: dTDP-4-dehydrorhamnose 3,5-epimerase [Spirochaetia bacterium]|nr:dTDP-4-dehydrorhamnose 3,5-epimerase [Spirochaetales bacterium]HRY81154.1 dTDP-4-dehydrorhamnose 3,5-epimerase [Spirochaetia bacterium]
MGIEVKQCPIPGLLEIQPRIFGDSRGYFFESWSARDYEAAGIRTRFVQDNESFSCRGVLRGLHFQKDRPQGKLVRAVRGEIFDVAVDIRPESPNRYRWHSVILSGDRHNLFYIPPGFAHGFLVLSETAIFSYKCTDFYFPEDEGGLAWDDPKLDIAWPSLGMEYILSEKDRRNPRLPI